jgi:hypothetical protein
MLASTSIILFAAAASAAASAAEPAIDVRVFGGPAAEMGTTAITVNRTLTRADGSTKPGTNAVTTTTTTSTITPQTLGSGIGGTYGLDLTWWPAGRFGLKAHYLGSVTGSGQQVNLLHLHGQDVATFKNETTTGTGGETTTKTMTDTTTITSPVAGGAAFSMAIGIPAAGAAGTLTTTYSTGGAAALTLRQGDTATTNPKSNFVSVGGMAFVASRWITADDISLLGAYKMLDASGGTIKLLGGMTVPIVGIRQSATAKTVGDKGQGDTAKETEQAFDNTGTTTFNRTTETTLDATIKSDAFIVAAGPTIGVHAALRPVGTLELYTQMGYSPVVGGSQTTSTTTTNKTKTVVTVTGATAGAPAGVTNGSTTTEATTTTPGQVIAPVAGSHAHAKVGASVIIGPVRVYGEGVVRSYNLTLAPLTTYGVRAGAGMSF